MTLRISRNSNILNLSYSDIAVNVCSAGKNRKGGFSETIFKTLCCPTEDRWECKGTPGEIEVFSGVRGPYIINLYDRKDDVKKRREHFARGLKKIFEYYPDTVINFSHHISDDLTKDEKKDYIHIMRKLCIKHNRCIVLHRL